jgi:hypothetical protein
MLKGSHITTVFLLGEVELSATAFDSLPKIDFLPALASPRHLSN